MTSETDQRTGSGHELDALQARIKELECPEVAMSLRFTLSGNEPPWHETGVHLSRGQRYTLLSTGRIQWSKHRPALYGGPGFHLWGRINPRGRAVNVAVDSGSFVADAEGKLELGIYFGLWRDDFGSLDTPREAYSKLSGEIEVLIIIWRDDAATGLEMLSRALPHPRLSTELARLRNPIQPPVGWDYLHETGFAEIYTDCGNSHAPRICLQAEDTQGIVRTPVYFALTPATRLSWRWRADKLPSEVAEDTAYTHDYISIAAEFDNGRDLTWIWSSKLVPGYHFPCPIKAWSARETHFVVRSGAANPGVWFDESRTVYRDVETAMGTPPSAIVAIWLICVSSFQHGQAEAAFENIRLTADGTEVQVL